MKRVMFVLLLAIAVAPSAWAQSWPNEPAGSTVISDWNLNSCPGGGWEIAYGCGQIVSDPTAPLSPSSVMQYSYNPATASGGGDPYISLNSSSELYIGLWAKTSNPFQGYSSNQNKLWVLSLNDGSWLWLKMNGPQNGPFQIVLTLQFMDPNVNDCHLPGWGDCGGTYNVYPNASSGNIPLGIWNRIEVYLKRSTSPTSRDGIMRIWINGTAAINVTNANTPTTTFGALFLTPSWDGSADPARTNPDKWWWDHIRVSGSAGGGGTPKGDTTPPAAPTSLRAF